MSIENFIFIKIDLSQPLFLFSSFQCSPFEKTHVLYNNLPMVGLDLRTAGVKSDRSDSAK